MKLFSTLFIAIFCLLSNACYSEIKVQLNKTSVSINETFTVVFSSNNRVQGYPDFTELEKDFDILSRGQNDNIMIVNGRASHDYSWTLVLRPKKEGSLIIPSIKFGNELSPPKSFIVTKAIPSKRDDAIYLETEIEPKEGYINSQYIYTLKLFRQVNIAQASLSEPKVNDPNAIIELLGNDFEYEHYTNTGVKYVVLERKYAVFPNMSGELVFEPVFFEGQVVRGRSFFNMDLEYKRIVSNENKAQVLPVPDGFEIYDWLPANNLTVNKEWASDPNKVSVGDPITLTLSIQADGALASSLPSIELDLPADVKQYNDAPQVSNKVTHQGVTGTKQIKIAIIPTKPGKLEIPEIKINWWNIKTNQPEELYLPPETMFVKGQAIALNEMNEDSGTVIEENTTPVSQNNLESNNIPTWAWVLIGLNGIWIVLLIGYIGKQLTRLLTFKIKPNSIKNIKYELKKACKENDPKKAEDTFIKWALSQYPDLKLPNLSEIKPYLSSELKAAVDQLNESLYGQGSDWKGNLLWKSFSRFKPKKVKNSNKEANSLKDLYSNE